MGHVSQRECERKKGYVWRYRCETENRSPATLRRSPRTEPCRRCGLGRPSDHSKVLRMKKIWVFCGMATAILLGGCSLVSEFTPHRPNYSSQAGWNRQGASSEETAAALSACNGEARAATARDANITTDILATRPNNWSNTGPGPIGTQSQYFSGGQSLFENQERDLSASVINQCMIGKGFVPGS